MQIDLTSPRTYAWLTAVTAVVTVALKVVAYLATGSAGLFSDAAEGLVNLAAALASLWALSVAARPPDADHRYGHSKAEYFSSALEGMLILIAALSIGVTAWGRLAEPQPLERGALGLTISMIAAVINGAVALVLLRAGRRLRSIALRASGHHLLTDVWTSVGVLVGVGLALITGWLILDPLVALFVAANIVWTGVRLLRDTGLGLMDTALPGPDQAAITEILGRYDQRGVKFHALRTRSAGRRRFVTVHVLVPGAWTVSRGHGLCEEIELEIRSALPDTTVVTHLEPVEDPISWEDQELDRHDVHHVEEHATHINNTHAPLPYGIVPFPSPKIAFTTTTSRSTSATVSPERSVPEVFVEEIRCGSMR